MDEIPESLSSGFQDAQIPDAILPDPPSQASLEQLLMPIEAPPARSPSPAFDRPTVQEFGGRNATTSSGLGSPENPILIDIVCEEGDIESEPGFAQCPILIEDSDALPESEDTELKSDGGLPLLHGSTTRTP